MVRLARLVVLSYNLVLHIAPIKHLGTLVLVAYINDGSIGGECDRLEGREDGYHQ